MFYVAREDGLSFHGKNDYGGAGGGGDGTRRGLRLHDLLLVLPPSNDAWIVPDDAMSCDKPR